MMEAARSEELDPTCFRIRDPEYQGLPRGLGDFAPQRLAVLLCITEARFSASGATGPSGFQLDGF